MGGRKKYTQIKNSIELNPEAEFPQEMDRLSWRVFHPFIFLICNDCFYVVTQCVFLTYDIVLRENDETVRR